MECGPFAAFLAFQVTEYGTLVGVFNREPSIRTSTLVIPELSEAEMLTLTCPLGGTEEPSEGEVMVTAGKVESVKTIAVALADPA